MDTVGVIVVEDSADLAEAVAIQLTSIGYTVRTARDGEQALELVRAERPHCVILDVLMPGMGGLELARRLRSTFGDDIVLLAMSGHANTHPAVKQAFGIVDHYLQKPFEFRELTKVLAPLI
jgi:DNA-binding response OmpR family regulator